MERTVFVSRLSTLSVRGKLVIVERREKFPEGPEMLRGWLTATAQHILAVRTERARKGKMHLGVLEAQGVLPPERRGTTLHTSASGSESALDQNQPVWAPGTERPT